MSGQNVHASHGFKTDPRSTHDGNWGCHENYIIIHREYLNSKLTESYGP